ncbi:hypothetical protein TRIUR3_28519 [Triticum urartu]|uniref:Uncharacterized protein n=1 Tax=Triticum urartu TaxID=4572 RepID=M8AIW3_TRIUA|nr:hypothetical protein TRIUR3_28519 [Triticum urartu]
MASRLAGSSGAAKKGRSPGAGQGGRQRGPSRRIEGGALGNGVSMGGIDLANDDVKCGQRRLAVRPMMACSVATSSTSDVGATPCSSSLPETRKEQLLRQRSQPPTSCTFELADPPSPPASSACRSAGLQLAEMQYD